MAPSSGAPPRRRRVLAERVQPREEARRRLLVVDDVGFYIGRIDDELAAVPTLRRAELDELGPVRESTGQRHAVDAMVPTQCEAPQPLVVEGRILGDGLAVRALLVRRDVARLAPPEPDESVWKSNFRRLTPSTRR